MTRQTQQEIIIPVSRGKISFSFIGCFLMMALGIALLNVDVQTVEWSRTGHSPIEVRVIGIIDILTFGTFLILGVRGFRRIGPGLIINRKGITIANSKMWSEEIRWSQVHRITVVRVFSQKFLAFHLHKPAQYMQKGSRIQRIFKQINMKFLGGHIHLSTVAFQISLKGLIAIINQYHSVEEG